MVGNEYRIDLRHPSTSLESLGFDSAIDRCLGYSRVGHRDAVGTLARIEQANSFFPVRVYTFMFRGTPLLVQLFLIYYGLSQLEWVRNSFAWPLLRDPFWCALLAFSLNNAAYTTEILRGGIRAVPVGEIEAAKALGMSAAQRIRRLVLPVGFRLALPAYGNEVVLILKASSLASTITLMELTGTSRKIVAQTFAPYEIFIAAALLYSQLLFCSPAPSVPLKDVCRGIVIAVLQSTAPLEKCSFRRSRFNERCGNPFSLSAENRRPGSRSAR